MSFSIKCTTVLRRIVSNRFPVSPAFILRAVTACYVALVHHNVCGEGSIQISVSIVHLLCEPVEVSGVCDLICTIFFCCRLIRRSTALVSTKAVDVIMTVLCACR